MASSTSATSKLTPAQVQYFIDQLEARKVMLVSVGDSFNVMAAVHDALAQLSANPPTSSSPLPERNECRATDVAKRMYDAIVNDYISDDELAKLLAIWQKRDTSAPLHQQNYNHEVLLTRAEMMVDAYHNELNAINLMQEIEFRLPIICLNARMKQLLSRVRDLWPRPEPGALEEAQKEWEDIERDHRKNAQSIEKSWQARHNQHGFPYGVLSRPANKEQTEADVAAQFKRVHDLAIKSCGEYQAHSAQVTRCLNIRRYTPVGPHDLTNAGISGDASRRTFLILEGIQALMRHQRPLEVCDKAIAQLQILEKDLKELESAYLNKYTQFLGIPTISHQALKAEHPNVLKDLKNAGDEWNKTHIQLWESRRACLVEQFRSSRSNQKKEIDNLLTLLQDKIVALKTKITTLRSAMEAKFNVDQLAKELPVLVTEFEGYRALRYIVSLEEQAYEKEQAKYVISDEDIATEKAKLFPHYDGEMTKELNKWAWDAQSMLRGDCNRMKQAFQPLDDQAAEVGRSLDELGYAKNHGGLPWARIYAVLTVSLVNVAPGSLNYPTPLRDAWVNTAAGKLSEDEKSKILTLLATQPKQ